MGGRSETVKRKAEKDNMNGTRTKRSRKKEIRKRKN
jgi:hypothetical protein